MQPALKGRAATRELGPRLRSCPFPGSPALRRSGWIRSEPRAQGWPAGPGETAGAEGGLGTLALPQGRGAFVHRRGRLSRRAFALMEARQLLARGTRPCPSSPRAATGKRAAVGQACRGRGALVQPGPSRAARPISAPALGGPVSGQRRRQSGRRAPIGRPPTGAGRGRGSRLASGWAAPAALPRRPWCVLLSWRRLSGDVENRRRFAKSPFSNWASF